MTLLEALDLDGFSRCRSRRCADVDVYQAASGDLLGQMLQKKLPSRISQADWDAMCTPVPLCDVHVIWMDGCVCPFVISGL